MISVEKGRNIPTDGILPQKGGTFTYWAMSAHAILFGGSVWNTGEIKQKSGEYWCTCDKFEPDADMKSVRFNIHAQQNTEVRCRTAEFIIRNDFDEEYLLKITQSNDPVTNEFTEPKPEPVQVIKKPVRPVDTTPWYKDLFNNICKFFKNLFK